MQDLKVTLIQKELIWEDPEANRRAFDELMDELAAETDLIVLPEMFTTGFSMRPEALAESPEGPTLAWMRAKAARFDAVITGSFIVRDGGRYYNRLHWVHPDGQVDTYDKIHLFSYGNEHLHYTAGTEVKECRVGEWKARPLICYDLRFPETARNTSGYDLLVYVANWPMRRIKHWRALLTARAIENQTYVIGVNRFGTDGMGIEHNGDSLIISPVGDILLEFIDGEYIETFTLSKKILTDYRSSFPALKDMK